MAWRVEFSPATNQGLANSIRDTPKGCSSSCLNVLPHCGRPAQHWRSVEGGKPWRLLEYRVGDYRIICAIEDDALRVLIVRIGNRREVYR